MLRYLLSHSFLDGRSQLFNAPGGIDALVALVNNPLTQNLGTHAAAALWNFASSNSTTDESKRNKEAVHNAGGTAALINLAKSEDASNLAREKAYGALRVLAKHQAAAHLVILGSGTDGVKLIIRGMTGAPKKGPSNNMKRNSAGLIANLSYCGASAAIKLKFQTAVAEHLEVIPILVGLVEWMAEGQYVTRELACDALSFLGDNNPTLQKRILDHGAIFPILSLIASGTPSSNYAGYRSGLQALWKISQLKEGATAAAKAGAIPILVKLLNEHRNMPIVANHEVLKVDTVAMAKHWNPLGTRPVPMKAEAPPPTLCKHRNNLIDAILGIFCTMLDVRRGDVLMGEANALVPLCHILELDNHGTEKHRTRAAALVFRLALHCPPSLDVDIAIPPLIQLCKSFAEETVVCSQLTEFATSALDAIAKRGEESCRKLIIAGGFNALSWFTMSANDGLPEPSEMTEDDYSRVSPDAMTSALAMCTCASKGTLPWWFLAKVGVVLPLIVVARFTEELSLPFFRGSRWRGMWDDSNLAEGDCHPPLHPMSRRELARVKRGLQEEAIGYLSELAARMPDL